MFLSILLLGIASLGTNARAQIKVHVKTENAFPTPVPLPCASCPGRSSDTALWRGWGVVCRGAACVYSGFRGPCSGPLCGPIVGPTASSRPIFCSILRTHVWNVVLGSLMQVHRIMNMWRNFWVHKMDPKAGPLTQRLGPRNCFKTGSANTARKATKSQKCTCAVCVSRFGRAGQSQSRVPGALEGNRP